MSKNSNNKKHNINKSQVTNKTSANNIKQTAKSKPVDNKSQNAKTPKQPTGNKPTNNKMFKDDSIGLIGFTATISVVCVAVIAVFLVHAFTSANSSIVDNVSSSSEIISSESIEQEATENIMPVEKSLKFNRDSVIYLADLKLDDKTAKYHDEFLSSSKANASSSSNNTSSNSNSEETPEASSSKPSSSYTTSVSVSTTNFQENLSKYQAINSDTVAWINVPGTNINYPVVKYASDNNYYIDKDVYKNYSRNGVIWADFRNSFPTLSKNTIFYGHNWTNISYSPRIGSNSDVMFAQLTSLQYTSQVAKYPYINVSVSGRDMKFVIFANFYTNVNFYYIDPNPSSLMTLVNGARERSESIINVDVNESDKILTLSTCTRAFGKSDKQRFVVMARLVRDGENLSNISVSKNPNPRRPF